LSCGVNVAIACREGGRNDLAAIIAKTAGAKSDRRNFSTMLG
jgi:hypothetical protein